MKAPRFLRRAVGVVTHNWPLKLAAIGLATFLYAGLVASQDSEHDPGPDHGHRPEPAAGHDHHEPAARRRLDPLPRARGQPASEGRDFRATVDLTNVKPDGQPVNVRVRVTALDPDVTILSVSPRTIQVVLDQPPRRRSPSASSTGPPPTGSTSARRRTTPRSSRCAARRPSSATVVAAEVMAALDPQGFDVDRDDRGAAGRRERGHGHGRRVEPATVHVPDPAVHEPESRTLPVNPVIDRHARARVPDRVASRSRRSSSRSRATRTSSRA